MNLYIKVENEEPVGYPILADNLKGILETSTLTDEIAIAAGYHPFENNTVPPESVLLSDDGFELLPTGIVRRKFTLREQTQEEKINAWVRPARENFLFRSDWTQSTDAPLTTEQKAAWAAYRQELRDLPSKYANVQSASDIVWPTPPAN